MAHVQNIAEWHGKDLVDRDGEKIGKLEDVYVDVETDEPMIIARVDQEPELAATTEGHYQRRGVYNLRPGVDLVLFVRNDVAGL